jgi:hypothetical protein
MKASRLLLALLIGLVSTACLRAAPGDWVQIGPAGAWQPTIAGTILNGRLYTAENNGGLYVTDLRTGCWRQIGKPEFGSTAFMFAANGSLYTIETDGSLYRVNPNDGCWVQVGPTGAWQPTIAGTILDGRLYTAENNGGLYVTDLRTGAWRQLGKAEFGATAWMFAAGCDLYTIEKDGSLYRVNPKDGCWVQVGPPGAWRPTIAGTILNGRLYTAENNGGLYVTDLATGAWQQLAKAKFGFTARMFAANGCLYTIETDGSLYRVSVR